MTETGNFSDIESSIQFTWESLHCLIYRRKNSERNPASAAYIAGAEQNQDSKALQINTPAAAAKGAFVWTKLVEKLEERKDFGTSDCSGKAIDESKKIIQTWPQSTELSLIKTTNHASVPLS